RRIPLRHRLAGLCRMDADAPDALAAVRVDGGEGRRLATTVARLHQHALRGEGEAGRPPAVLPRVSTGRVAHIPAHACPGLEPGWPRFAARICAKQRRKTFPGWRAPPLRQGNSALYSTRPSLDIS